MMTDSDGLASVYPQPKDLQVFINKQLYNFNYECAMPVTWPWKPEEEFETRPIEPMQKNI